MRLMVPALPRFQRSMVIQVIEVMEPFDKVVEACFGMQLKDSYVSLTLPSTGQSLHHKVPHGDHVHIFIHSVP